LTGSSGALETACTRTAGASFASHADRSHAAPLPNAAAGATDQWIATADTVRINGKRTPFFQSADLEAIFFMTNSFG
jgi:hypothetical protein